LRRRLTIAAAAAALLSVAAPAAASARLTLSEASAERVAETYGAREVARMSWVDEWSVECSRVTPWTFGCTIWAWRNTPAYECAQTVDVELPDFGLAGYRPRIEHVYRWECD